MNDKRWRATLRALARHGMQVPTDFYLDPGKPVRSGQVRLGGICPASLLKARGTCFASVEWVFPVAQAGEHGEKLQECDLCDTEDD
jgi:hypothetical protein